MTSTVANTLAMRQKTYGTFLENATIAQLLKRTLRTSDNFNRLRPDQGQALDVICDKMARILSGDPDYIDNWHDIQGYAMLVENSLQQKEGMPVAD